MKKIMFFALAAAGLFASCSSDDALTSDVQKAEELNSDLVPIKVNLGNSVMTATRGSGTVGSNDASLNKWNNETFKLYMFEKGTLEPADDDLNPGTPLYVNEDFNAGNAAATNDSVLATASSGITKYYPRTKKFDFWAYRLDDCTGPAGAAIAAPAVDPTDATKMTVDFEINGTQDVMVAQANRKGFPTADPTDGNVKDKSYSAWSARKGYYPNLEFNHLLSRLAFKVKAGSAETLLAKLDPADPTNDVDVNLTVKKIEVFSAIDGKLIVAYTGDSIQDANRITWDDPVYDLNTPANNDPYFLELTDAAGAAFTPEHITGVVAQDCGDALLVRPADANGYYFRITLEQDIFNPAFDSTQPVDATLNPYTVKKETTTTSKIIVNKTVGTDAVAQAFLPGYTYDVTITVWGLSEISVYTTLNRWVKWGDNADEEPIEVDPEEYN